METLSLDTLKQKVFQNSPEVKAVYERKTFEFSIAEQLVQMRKSCGLTQRQLAEKAGIVQPHIARLESAKQLPKLDTLYTIVESLGYSLEIKIIPKKRK